MGLITFGFPPDIVLWLRERLKLNVFVEAGTYRGDSALFASNMFCRVITIEKSDLLFIKSKNRLENFANIACYNGCTRDHIVAHLSIGDSPLFWLDAHWSGGVTAGQDDECPILDELYLIFNLGLDSLAILIDDARLFTAPPPKPHDSSQWPRIDQIAKALPDNYAMYLFNDVIYVVPDCVADDFSNFLQNIAATHNSAPIEKIQVFGKTIKKLIRSLSKQSIK